MEPKGSIFSINISDAKGTAKRPVRAALLLSGRGIEGDAHVGAHERQVSLLMHERISEQSSVTEARAGFALKPGDFAENITTRGLELRQLKPGDRIRAGAQAVLRISRLGKECHKGCRIRTIIGDCIMPREGVFAEVEKGGSIAVGDPLEILARGC